MYFVLLTLIPQRYIPEHVFSSSYIYSTEIYSGTGNPFLLHLFCSDIFRNRHSVLLTFIPQWYIPEQPRYSVFLHLFRSDIFRNRYSVLFTFILQRYIPEQVIRSSYIYSAVIYSGTGNPFFLHLFRSDIFRNRYSVLFIKLSLLDRIKS